MLSFNNLRKLPGFLKNVNIEPLPMRWIWLRHIMLHSSWHCILEIFCLDFSCPRLTISQYVFCNYVNACDLNFVID